MVRARVQCSGLSFCPYSPECSMALVAGRPRSRENEPLLRLFSHQYLKESLSEALPALVGSELLPDEQPEGAEDRLRWSAECPHAPLASTSFRVCRDWRRGDKRACAIPWYPCAHNQVGRRPMSTPNGAQVKGWGVSA